MNILVQNSGFMLANNVVKSRIFLINARWLSKVHGSRIHARGCFLYPPSCCPRVPSKCFIPGRTIVKSTKKSQFQATQSEYIKDQITKDYILIYRDKMGKKYLSIFLGTGLFLIGYGAVILFWLSHSFLSFLFKTTLVTVPILNIQMPHWLAEAIGPVAVLVAYFLLFVYRFAKTPAIRIYQKQNMDQFVGILKKTIFTTERVEFSIKDVVVKKSKKIEREGNVSIKGRPCTLYALDFKNLSYFNSFLGFDYQPSTDDNKETPQRKVSQKIVASGDKEKAVNNDMYTKKPESSEQVSTAKLVQSGPSAAYAMQKNTLVVVEPGMPISGDTDKKNMVDGNGTVEKAEQKVKQKLT